MKIAIPVAQGKLCMHFGHCEVFTIFDVDGDTKNIKNKVDITPPPHEPGVLPRWLSEQGANCIIAGGMGSRAKGLFEDMNITVVTGAPAGDPEAVVMSFLNDNLEIGPNACDH